MTGVEHRISSIGFSRTGERDRLLGLGRWNEQQVDVNMSRADWDRLMRRWGRATNPFSLIRHWRPDHVEVREARGGGLLLRLAGQCRWVLLPSAVLESDER